MLALGIGAAGLFMGIAVGATGIGGVLLVPFLTLVLGIQVKQAIAATIFAYLPSGAVAIVLYARRGSIEWQPAAYISLGALPAAWIGAQAASLASPNLLQAAIGVLLLAGGAAALRPPRPATTQTRRLKPWHLLALGAITGFFAALTGAGGAFILLPMLLLLDTQVLTAIGLGQTIAIPIAGVASITNLVNGLIDFKLSAGLAVTLSAGVAIGTPIAHALPQEALRRTLGIVIVLSGSALLVRAIAVL